MTSLSEQHIATIKDAAKKLTCAKRRAFQAQESIDYLNSTPCLAEKIFGWDRKTVALGCVNYAPGSFAWIILRHAAIKKRKRKIR